MYYRLKDEYALRGYQGATCMLVKRPTNVHRALTSDEFKILLLCDGTSSLDSNMLTTAEEAELQRMLERGVIVSVPVSTPLSEEQVYRVCNNRFVPTIHWSITGGCNFRCRHCFMDAPTNTLGELTHDEAIHLIDEMAECGVLNVDLTGGEPFIRQDFWQLVDHLQKHQILVRQIYTNGWLLTEKVLDEFERRNLHPEFSISFDGIGWHDWMRGIQGAEQRVWKVFAMLQQRGFPCNVEMCIHKGNVSVMSESIRKLAQSGVHAIKTINVSPSELWLRNSEGYAMSDQEYVESMLNYIPDFFADGMPCDLMHGGVISMRKNKTEYRVLAERYGGTEKSCLGCYLCGAVRTTSYISPEGRLLPCMPMSGFDEQHLFSRVQEIGLQKGLSDSFYMQIASSKVKDLLAVNKECNACPHKLKCGGGCRAHALRDTHMLMGKDPMYCMLWNGGYVERIHEVADAAIAKYCPAAE